jgi:RNA polymerase sigma-70 factor (ECF subfamily)
MSAPLDPLGPEAPDDAVVIARVLGGDKQQFEYLVSRYQRLLYRHAVAMVLDHDVAADMVQDSFVRAYVNLRECRDPSRFRAWLFRTLRNRCLDHLKEASRRHVRLDDLAETPVDRADAPSTLAERSELRVGIARALEQLPPTLREAFVMHYVEDMPYETMAELLDVSVSALKMRALRAREALRLTLRTGDVTGEPSLSSLFQARLRL